MFPAVFAIFLHFSGDRACIKDYVFIDPPYNTGKDFVYSDDYKDNLENYLKVTGQKAEDGGKFSTNSESNGRYHTNWLNMMYPRLRLARNLLRDDGVVFISIDDKEVSNLIKICNEIFGEENFIACIAVVNNMKGRSDDKFIATAHESLLMYQKLAFETFGVEIPDEYIEEYDKEDENGRKYRLQGLRKRGSGALRSDRPNMYYEFFYNLKLNKLSLEKQSEQDIIIFPKLSDGQDGRWRWGIETSKERINELCARKVAGRDEWDVFQIDYLINENGERRPKPKSVWLGTEFSSDSGTIVLKELGLAKIFPNPKPVELIKYCLTQSTKNNDIIIDFFSGSCTSAHAVFQLNKEDGGNRKFIMVQIPEPCGKDTEAYKAGYKNICEIGKERIRRAGELVKSEQLKVKSGKKAEDNQLTLEDTLNSSLSTLNSVDVGFKVFKLDSSNLKKWNPDYDNLDSSLEDMISNYVDGRTELDVVYEIMLKYGIDLTLPVEEYDVNGKKLYSIGFGALIICLDDEITKDIVNDIIKLKKELNPEMMRVVFKDNGFKDDAVKTNVKENLKQAGIEDFVTV